MQLMAISVFASLTEAGAAAHAAVTAVKKAKSGSEDNDKD